MSNLWGAFQEANNLAFFILPIVQCETSPVFWLEWGWSHTVLGTLKKSGKLPPFTYLIILVAPD